MDTLAAFLWRQSIEDDMKPVRWHLWDEELVQQLGDDATYADLVQALIAKASES